MRGVLVWVGVLMVVCPRIAAADGLDSTDRDRSNKGQFGLSAKVAAGYRGIFPYAEDPDYFCGSNGGAGELGDPCQGRTPLGLDLGLEYRVFDSLGVLLEMRFGIERDFGVSESESGPRQRVLAPGVRAYLRDEAGFKFFVGLQFTADLTDYAQADGNDYGLRLTPGVMLDPHRTVGLIAFFGPMVSWSRWLQFGMEGGLGIQARFP